MSVAQAQQQISAREFAEWMAFNRIEPFGAERMDIGFAIVASTVANSLKGKKGSPFKLTEFLPMFTSKPAMSERALKAVVGALKRAWPKGKK